MAEEAVIGFELYRPPNAPPSDPDGGGVGSIRAVVRESLSPQAASHVVAVGMSLDVRDGSSLGAGGDYLYVPDRGGARYRVYAVVRRGARKLCYVRRESAVTGAGGVY